MHKTHNAVRRELMLKAVAAGAVGMATYAGWVQQAIAAPGPSGMQKLKGDVKVNGEPAKIGVPIKPGDVVTTGEDSLAVFVVDKDAYLLRYQSRLEIAKPEESGLVKVLRLVTGALLSTHAPGEKRIQTSSATIGIRGTGIYMEASAERTYLCTCYGLVDIVGGAEGKLLETVKTRNHEAPRFIYPADAAKVITPAPMLNHTDAELIMLESLLGRRPPFVKDGPNPYG